MPKLWSEVFDGPLFRVLAGARQHCLSGGCFGKRGIHHTGLGEHLYPALLRSGLEVCHGER